MMWISAGAVRFAQRQGLWNNFSLYFPLNETTTNTTTTTIGDSITLQWEHKEKKESRDFFLC